MLKNYFKMAFRTLQKNAVFSVINIVGLTVGLCSCMLVSTVVLDDLSYDKFWKRSDDLYRVSLSNKMGDGIYTKEAYSPVGLGTELKERFPEIEAFSTVMPSVLQLKPTEKETDGIKTQVLMLDSAATKMFDFKRISGQTDYYVPGQQNIWITESFRKRFFKGVNPIGKIITDVPSWKEDATPFLITAVVQDIPQNTHLRADVIVLKTPRAERLNKEGAATYAQVYYLLKPRTNVKSFESKINDWYAHFLDMEKGKITFSFQPIRDIYLHSEFNTRQEVQSNIRSLYIFGGIGVFILVIACINFINLSTARAMQRLKESGIRKILGAERKQLIWQFLIESLLFFFLSTVFALLVYLVSLPTLEVFLEHGLTETIFEKWPIFIFTILIIFVLSLFTGAYPAIFLSRLNPSDSLKGHLDSSLLISSTVFRKALVVIQFSIAIVTLIALIVVRSQLHYINQKDLGFRKDNLLYINMVSWQGKGEAIKAQLNQLSGVLNASITTWRPESGTSSGGMTIDHPRRKGEQVQMNIIFGDVDLAQTIGLVLKKGRLFNKAYGTDTHFSATKDSTSKKNNLFNLNEERENSSPALITAATAQDFGIEKADMPISGSSYSAVGIVKDFYYESLHHQLMPTIITLGEEIDFGGMFVRVAPGAEQQVLTDLHKLWKSFYPDKLLATSWMDDIVQLQYKKEEKQQTLFTIFSGLMFFISSLGVFGLVLHAAEQRVKEIGIRKVLGASVRSIVTLLSKDFVKLVLLAILLATPIAWWGMSKWLEDFAYRVDMQWWMFIMAGGIAVFIALTIVSSQAIKAAIANPVDSLRNE